jgi:predicted PurR-regulated permease PerM
LNSTRRLFREHWRLITFIISLTIFIWLIWNLISIIIPFLIGLIIAYLLLPIVRWLEKHLPGGKKHPGAKRISIIVGIYFVALIIIAAMGFYMFMAISSSASLLWQNLPQLITGMVDGIENILANIRLQIPAGFHEQFDETIASAGLSLVNTLRNGLGSGLSLVTSSIGLILGFLALPLIVFFVLKDWDKLRDGFFGIMPAWASEHAKNVSAILQRILGRYIRGQIILSVFVGGLVFILLTILGIPFAPALAIWAALMENIPTLGFWFSVAATAAVGLATSPEKVIWIILGLILIQLLENNLLVPRIQGSNMKMNPVFILLISIVGAHLIGIVGFIIAVPIAATVIELLKYFKQSFQRKEAE